MKKTHIWISLVVLVGACAFFAPRVFEDGIAIGNQATTITMDGSGNMKFADAVSGNLLLSELEGGGGTTDHTLLTNIGDSTHAELEAAIIANKTDLEDTVSLGSVVTLHSDTIPVFIFGGYEPGTDVAMGVLPAIGHDTLLVVEIYEVVAGTTVSCDYNIYWNGYYTATGAKALMATDRAVNAATTGSTIGSGSLQNRKITPQNTLWAIMTDATTPPDEIYIQVMVQKISSVE